MATEIDGDIEFDPQPDIEDLGPTVEDDTNFDVAELHSTEPLIVPSNIDELIAQHMLNLFNRYRDTNIAGTVKLEISAIASSGARELAVESSVTVGPWDKSASFKSRRLVTSFEKAIDRYRENETYAVLALPAF